MRFDHSTISDTTAKQAREYLRAVPDTAERRQMEQTTGTFFSPDSSRAEMLLARLALRAEDPQAAELLPIFADFVAWLKAEEPEEPPGSYEDDAVITAFCDIIDELIVEIKLFQEVMNQCVGLLSEGNGEEALTLLQNALASPSERTEGTT